MAREANIGGDGALFIGEDKQLNLELLDGPSELSTSLPVDMSGWSVKLFVRTSDAAADPAVLEKTATIVGIFNAARAVNTQRARVTLTDTEMLTVAARMYRHAWKRMDDASETVLAYGRFYPQRSPAS